MVVAQLVEQRLPTPEIRGSNTYAKSTNCTIEKTKIKKKRPGMVHLKKLSLFGNIFIFARKEIFVSAFLLF